MKSELFRVGHAEEGEDTNLLSTSLSIARMVSSSPRRHIRRDLSEKHQMVQRNPQFLELKHSFEPFIDSIVTNSKSNLIFLSRYEYSLYGLTGTIAEFIVKETKEAKELNDKVKKEYKNSVFEQFLKKSYDVNIFKIPTTAK
jgi:hypothetical protein